MKKGVAILGSTGSIGTQTLEVISSNPELFSLELITGHKNSKLLIEQAKKFRPNEVVVTDESLYQEVKEALRKEDIKVFSGMNAVCQSVEMSGIEIVLTAMVGYQGLKPTIAAINAGKNIALANKETLVVAGELITSLCKEKGVNIYPVDSEHSAIFQCLAGEFHNPVEKIYLTASGGPFRGMNKEQLEKVTKSQALKHPNWNMGAKITIDSATMMNKGLEVIEAKWLFGLKKEQISIIVHPQSVIHSIVQFGDGSMKAQMGIPDMRLPIQYALGYPKRITNDFERFDFLKYPSLTFEKANPDTFRNISLAYFAMEKGGNAPCVLNASNEVAVDLFLNDKISFTDIFRINEKSLENYFHIQKPSYEDYVNTDMEIRKKTKA